MNIDYARRQMIDQQVRAWTILDAPVLETLAAIERERFVPPGYESLAFADMEIPLGHGQAMMTPTIEGRVLQALELGGSENVLEIGTGSGFLTACLASLAHSVTSIDLHTDFVQRAGTTLADCGIEDVSLLTMDGTQELPQGKFDVIVVTGSLAALDQRYIDALQPDGRLFVVVGEPPVMEARLIRRTGDHDWESETLFETTLSPLVNGGPPPQFSF
jgi:protein-L-isoaspartate(D-aspartate) O-methyltransferase